MDTTEVLGRLKELQDILSEKYKYEELVRRSPQQLSNQEELLERLKKQYIEKNTVYDETRAAVGGFKAELAQAEINRERGEKGMDDIQSHREYEALAKEILDAGNTEQRIRKELQKEERNLAEIHERLAQDEQIINALETELASGKATLAAEIETYKKTIDELAAREGVLIKGVDEEIVFKFERIMTSDRIISSKEKQGIVAVRGNVCNGCHMILPYQFANEVREGTSILFCPYCSRVLEYQESEMAGIEYYQNMDDETSAMTDFDSELDDLFNDGEDSLTEESGEGEQSPEAEEEEDFEDMA